MIQKIYSIICDECGRGIDHIFGGYPDYKNIRELGIVISKGKHFCDEECKKENSLKI